MAGTILASSPHYFSAVEDYHACLMKTWLALATLRSTQIHPNHIVTNFVQPAFVFRKDSIFDANRVVTSMY
ncbi:hypothetical protein Lalb_Chr00c29g0408351 (mitochondrion) [Lupinus albus]|uniref:Uncharacterized protein n=1 Tax=Lupinus albus TaxID=3870 RepID=A0A6A4N142_LUPAL|nr:hypothetical protein Lalb_Chr00c29g0407791 [Lupinus albus]KAE9584269.1 hypothetical protein Lalb_Chr00c29g0408351 [Lupinus albus]